MKAGDIIERNGLRMLVLDIYEEKYPFVLALNIGTKIPFQEYQNISEPQNYNKSSIKDTIDAWILNTGFKVIPREISLRAMDGYDYGSLVVDAALLTFDEWRKYSRIIKSHIDYPMWLATAWSAPSIGHSSFICSVNSDGGAGYINYYRSYYWAPAFVLKNIPEQDLSSVSTEALMQELHRRIHKRED